ncbi:hypothetical protein DXG03_001870, partial [Asterophora parasitica]
MSTVPPASQANPQALEALVPPPAPPMMSLASLLVTALAVTLAASPPMAATPTVAITPAAAAPSQLCLLLPVTFTKFYEPDVEVTASLALESESYYQHKHDIDAYIDSFQSPYWKAGYPDRHHLVMKFHHSLSKRISNHLRNITTGCPNNTCVKAWITVAHEQAFIMKTEADFSQGWLAAKPAKRTPTTIP